MRDGEARTRGRVHTQALENLVRALASGLQPDFIEPQNVAIRMPVGRLRKLVQGIDERLEFLRKLGEYRAQYAPRAARVRHRKRAVGASAHRDVIVDVDELAGETLGEEPGNEERYIPEPLQAAVAVLGRGRLEGLRQHDGERL